MAVDEREEDKVKKKKNEEDKVKKIK